MESVNVRTFVVIPNLPEALEPLRDLAYNLWWSWKPTAMDLFRRLDYELWEEVGRNPVRLMWQIDQQRLVEAAEDPAYVAQLTRVADEFYIYLNARTWFHEQHPDHESNTIAYFSAEFGLHECLPIYSGGLGVLAGDHLKSASDLGIPLVGVGLMYREGYFNQQISEDGWQLEHYESHDFHQWPATQVKDKEGAPVQITLHLGDRPLHARVWRVQVGRVDLFLLDTDFAENPPEFRAITSQLYGGGTDMRVRQELLLGVGGLRALHAIGVHPDVCHMNEGHAAFLALERIRLAMVTDKLTYAEAKEATSGGNVFTTHTPVPAGIDRFDPNTVRHYLGWMAGELGISLDEMIALGREADGGGAFCMPLLAFRTSYRNNGVSKLHGEVSRRMWQSTWPGLPLEEVPIGHVTNGIHIASWISPEMAELLDQHVGPVWSDQPDAKEAWARVAEIPDSVLWRVHERRRERLVGYVRRNLRMQLQHRGAPPNEIEAVNDVLDPDALTIGFARRFAPYKRATLLFRDLDRLRAIVCSKERPVQFIFAGKAHPADSPGKELIKQIAQICKMPEFRRKIVFLENYDTSITRTMVRGVDVWLNNPLRPHEASGTSGMKVPPNGGLNLSVLDGWWPEAYNGQNGWAIGDGSVYDDQGYQDHVESESMYNLLERSLVPDFYQRGADGVPRHWVRYIKESMKTICPVFNTHRMLKDYVEDFYEPALARFKELTAGKNKLAKRLSAWKSGLRGNWHEVAIKDVWSASATEMKVGESFELNARVHLGRVEPADVAVEVYLGPVDSHGKIVDGKTYSLTESTSEKNGSHVFAGKVDCVRSGQYGYAVRVVPKQADLSDRATLGLVHWG